MLISVFGFGILQIASGCVQIGRGRAAAAAYRRGITSLEITTDGSLTT